MSLKLHGPVFPGNLRMHKILVAAKLANLPIEAVNLEVGVANETTEYKNNCSPIGRTPVLETEEGYIFESNAILRYVARQDKSNTFLYGRTNYEATLVDSWVDYSVTELEKSTMVFIMNVVRGVPIDAETEKSSIEQLHLAFEGLERWLETRTFLVGERLTIADIAIALTSFTTLTFVPNGENFKKYKGVFRLVNTVVNQPKVYEVLKAQGFDTTLTLRKEEKPAAAPKPKEEKKPAAAAAAKPKEDDAEEEEDELVVEKKKPNPLDLLPPSKFVLDAFKREYSNKDTRKEAAPWFFENFDSEGFSAFWCKYKYNDDLKMQFMTANLVRGWFQRMDHVRKYTFGSVLIIGEEKKHEVVGFWVFRGQGIPEIVKEVEDTELFDWTPIPDIKAEAAKITDYLAWDGESFAKSPVLEGRAYK